MIPAEYKLGNYTPKGWILKRAREASGEEDAMSMVSFENAIFAAFDAANEIGFDWREKN